VGQVIKLLQDPLTHTHPLNDPFSGTTQVSRYQKGKTNLDFTEARDSEWQWQQLGHMQVCTSLQTDNHASTPPLSFLQAGSVIMSGNEARSRNVFRNSRCGMHAYSARVYVLMCRMSTVTWFRSGIVSVHCHWNELCCAFSTLWWLANSEQSCSRKPSSPSFEYAFRLYQSFFLSVCLSVCCLLL